MMSPNSTSPRLAVIVSRFTTRCLVGDSGLKVNAVTSEVDLDEGNFAGFATYQELV
jgi:hypothetical protein